MVMRLSDVNYYYMKVQIHISKRELLFSSGWASSSSLIGSTQASVPPNNYCANKTKTVNTVKVYKVCLEKVDMCIMRAREVWQLFS